MESKSMFERVLRHFDVNEEECSLQELYDELTSRVKSLQQLSNDELSDFVVSSTRFLGRNFDAEAFLSEHIKNISNTSYCVALR